MSVFDFRSALSAQRTLVMTAENGGIEPTLNEAWRFEFACAAKS